MERDKLVFEIIEYLDSSMSGFIDEDSINGFLNDIENRVNGAISLLNNIKSVSDLDNIETCLNTLKELASDLY